MRTKLKRLTCLLVALALVPGLLSGLAEDSQATGLEAPVAEVNDLALTADEGDAGVSSNDANGDIDEKKGKSEDTPDRKLTPEEKRAAEEMKDKVEELLPKTGDFESDGKQYYDMLDGTPEEQREAMKTIAGKDLFYKFLTKPTKGSDGTGDLFYSVWLPAAAAALRGGGYNRFYYVDDYWTPSTFRDAFLDFSSTWCNPKAQPSSFTDSAYRSSETSTTKYQYARSFGEVGEVMKRRVQDCSEYVYQGLSGGKAAYDHILDRWTVPDYQGDIFFVPFSEVIHRGFSYDHSSGHLGYAWDAFAVCFYDFKLKPLTQFMKTGEKDTPTMYYQFNETPSQSVALNKNESAEETSFSSERSDSETTSVSTTLSTSRTLSFTENSSVHYTVGLGKTDGLWRHTIEIGFDFSSTQSQTTEESRTTGTSKTHTDTWTISGTLKPATQATFSHSTGTSTGAVAYNCPVEFQYKVAVLSLCGTYSGALPYRSVNVTYAGVCRIFGERGGDALTDLADRLAHPETDNFHLDFGDSEFYAFKKSDVTTYRMYSSVGGTNTFNISQDIGTSSVLTPLYKLDKTEMPPDKASLTLYYSEEHPEKSRVNLGTLDVKGLAVLNDTHQTEVPYYGFSPARGEWKLVDDKGEAIESTECAAIETTPAGKFLVAKQVSRTPIYLKYFINDGIYPKNPLTDQKEYLTNGDLSKSAVVEVFIAEYVDDIKRDDDATVIPLNAKGKNPDAIVYLGDKVVIDPVFATSQGLKVTGIKSSNKRVAEEIGEGFIELHKAGKTTITATAKNGRKRVTAKIKLIVADPAVPAAIAIDQGDALMLGLNEQGVQLTVTAGPKAQASNAVKWKSLKKNVVKVDANGVLTPRKKGTAQITATSTLNKKAKATITVTVAEAEDNGALTVSPETPPAVEPEAPAEAPEASAEAPKAPAEAPEASAEAPEAPAQAEGAVEGEAVVSESVESAVAAETVELAPSEN